MKIASWILTALSYVLAIPFIVVGVLSKDIFYHIFAAILFVALGFTAHVLINKAKSRGDDIGKDGLAVYIISFPQFIIPFAAIFIILMIVKLADFFIYMLTDKHYVLNGVNFVLDVLLGRSHSDIGSADEDEEVGANYSGGKVFTVHGLRAKDGAYYDKVDFELVVGGYVKFPIDGKPIDGVVYPNDFREYPLYRDIKGLAPYCTSLDGGQTLIEIPKYARDVQVYIP